MTDTAATLTGVINPNKEETTYNFEYGTTTAYGAKTPDGTASGNAGKDVSETVTGLAPNTLYHYRLVATNPSGTDTGSDMTFTTLPASNVNAPAPSAITAGANPATVTFGSTSVISGQLTGDPVAGVDVQLEQTVFPFTDGFKSTGAKVQTDATGAYSFTVMPSLNTRYQVVAKASPPVTSAMIEILVRHKVSFRVSDNRVRRGQRVTFKGAVAPAHATGRVKIQRRTSTGFKTVTRALVRQSTTSDSSTYRKRVRIKRKGTYRVRFSADAGHVTGTSRKRTIRIG